MVKLGVNIDHVATLRQARREKEPDPVWAAVLCELAGCHSIVVHLREDRRHINERDLRLLRSTVKVKLNLEMSIAKEIVDIACEIKPDQATLVPERREEITTEGGLDVIAYFSSIKEVVERMHREEIMVSLFIDPIESQIKKAKEAHAEFIELHTGAYANAQNEVERERELMRLIQATQVAKGMGLRVNAGHGLNYLNVRNIAKIPGIEELNIGHAIISRAVFVGLERAVKEMLELLK
ncbi:MAG: pyridoxine 5'-phosphate synthase [Candidatus Omnitrophica bacterium]|nr:pyridoxine 5'-phosphate synthase [Candidatus Omnitrophota bacterium]MCM8792992.1 pyridoxine 5'-phosphate synthase [Candidatus Omnitrophota bacterium]